jgi:hypothetical protein
VRAEWRTGGNARPPQGSLKREEGNKYGFFSDPPVRSHGYWAIGEYKDFLLFQPSYEVGVLLFFQTHCCDYFSLLILSRSASTT